MQRKRRYALLLTIATIHSVNASGEPIRCGGHASGVSAVDLSPDGSRAVSVGDKFLVRIWDTRDGSPVRTLSLFPPDAEYGFISDAAFSPDGESIAVAAWRQPITFWDVASGRRLEKTLPVERSAQHLAFSPDGSNLAVAEYAAVRVWALQDATVVHEHQFNGQQIGPAWRVAFSPDGLLLAAALHDYGGSFIPKEPKVRAWNAQSGDIVFTARNDWSASGVAFSPDSRLLAAIGEGVDIWDVTAHTPVRRIAKNERGIMCLAFSPDGRMLAIGGNDPEIKLWETASGRLSGTLKGHEGQVHDLCFSADGKSLLSGGSDKQMLIWTLKDDIDID